MAPKLLREPLLHFLLIGAALFVAYGWLHPGAGAPARIVVTQQRVEAIVAQFQATWQRPPTREEMRALVDSWVADEILYREGASLGLLEDDPVVKRRARQKYEVLAEESQPRAAPTDADLAAYLAAHADAFRRPGRVSFEQVLVAPAGSATDVSAAVESARAALAAGKAPAGVGVATMLPAGGDDVDLDVVARDFGGPFAAKLESLPVGTWSGPVESGFGVHLVRVTARVPGGVPPLDDVRGAVTREWESARRREAREAQLRALRERYDVVVEADLNTVPAARVASQ